MTTPPTHHPHLEQLRGAAIVVLLVYHASLLIAPRATLEAALLQLAHAGWLATLARIVEASGADAFVSKRTVRFGPLRSVAPDVARGQ